MTFTADGKMKRQPIGSGNKGEGTWKLSKDGFCSTWKGAKDNCFTVCQRRRQSMVGAQGLDHHGDVEQIGAFRLASRLLMCTRVLPLNSSSRSIR